MGEILSFDKSPIAKGIGQTMMQDAKFFMDYSRWQEDVAAFESWEQAVKRVMNMHRTKYADRMTPELEEMIQFAEDAYLDQRLLAAQRTLQFGGDQIFKHEAKVYNCFDEAEQFVTSAGVRSFRDCKDGEEVVVASHTGKWQKAIVRSYGHQKFNRITLCKGTNETEVFATSDHRWLLKDGSETTTLSVGDNLLKPQNAFGEFDYDLATPTERLYWCYGMVYGDGTRVKKNGTHTYSMIRLCGKDARFVERFEEMGFKTGTHDSLKGDAYAYTGTYLKTAPDPSVDSPEMVRAFVAGYLQADGEKSRNNHGTRYTSIQCSDTDHIDFIRKCFPIAGVWIISETDLTDQQTNLGKRPYTISFRTSDNMGSKYNAGWKVKAIEPAVKSGIAWCLEVNQDRSFIMPNGVVTGNCAATYADRSIFFGQALYLLLCGTGAGFSVQKHHVAKLPNIKARSSESKLFVIEDSIEGWKDAVHALISSFLESDAPKPEYQGYHVNFDYGLIRPKGALISGGFKAPGPDGLRSSLTKVEELLQRATREGNRLRPIHVYDIVMHLADAVLSGGVRRSATICMFSKDDQEMLNAKTGNWFNENPQRGRSNNSVVLKRDELTREEWAHIMKSVRDFGEPGFIFTEDLEFVFNPCVEIGMRGYDAQGRSGWQMCNLSEINGSKCNTLEDLLIAAKAGSIIGTLQAGYTHFPHMDDDGVTQSIVEREALIGVSITGWMNNPDVLFDEFNMQAGALEVRKTNEIMAKLLGINPAARTTCVKPSGNASVMLGTSSGIHGEHSPRFFRNMQMNEMDEGLQEIIRQNPEMVEDSVWSATGTDKMVSFPLIAKEGSIFKRDLLGVKQLDYVKKAQQFWVEYGTADEFCVDKRLRHNVSNTISVDDWDEVEQYLYDNRQWFAGVSLLAKGGDKAYPQAPFQEVLTGDEIYTKYGDAAMFASGLLVDGLHAFNSDLWAACFEATEKGKNLSQHGSHDLLKRDWVRRALQFAERYFSGDLQATTDCLKDVYNLHRWKAIERSLKPIDFTAVLTQPKYVDINTTGAQACSGGACEI